MIDCQGGPRNHAEGPPFGVFGLLDHILYVLGDARPTGSLFQRRIGQACAAVVLVASFSMSAGEARISYNTIPLELFHSPNGGEMHLTNVITIFGVRDIIQIRI